MPDEARFDQRFNADAGRCLFSRETVCSPTRRQNDLMAAIVMPPARVKAWSGTDDKAFAKHPLESIAGMRMHDGGKSRE
jgi:hypothetical protein